MNKKITGYLLIFLGVYLLTLLLFPAKKREQTMTQTTPVMFQTVRTEYPIGDTVKATINNTSTGAILFTPQPCPQPPLIVLKNNTPLQVSTTYHCNSDPITIQPGNTYNITTTTGNQCQNTAKFLDRKSLGSLVISPDLQYPHFMYHVSPRT